VPPYTWTMIRQARTTHSTLQTGKPQSFLLDLKEKNSRKEFNRPCVGLQVDPGAMLILTLGNPVHFQFQLQGSSKDLSFSIGQKGKCVAEARLYRDPMRGGGYLSPQVEQEFRNLGVGILVYTVAARLALLLWNEAMHSNSQQLTPSAVGVWKALVAQGLAIHRGGKDFSFHRNAVESESFGRLLDVVMTMQDRSDVFSQSHLFKMPPVSGEKLRRNLSGKRKPYEYWLRSDYKR